MIKISMIKCLEAYQVKSNEDIKNLPVRYRTNQSLKYLLEQYNIIIDNGLIYTFNKSTNQLKYVFDAYKPYEIKHDLTAYYVTRGFKYNRLLDLINK